MDKNSDYRMFSNLSDIQLKVNGYKHSLINEAHGNHKPKTYKKYTRKKGKESEHNMTESHQHTKEKGTEKNYKNNQKTINGNNTSKLLSSVHAKQCMQMETFKY